ncbi:MAG: sugar ABC transporter permease [Acidobacteria bacterium]|nr:MAG: sugar ABC transporter permease [Acidobacteriota bacterium]
MKRPRLIPILVLLPGTFLAVLPFMWMLTTALKPDGALYQPPFLIPVHFDWRNFTEAWRLAPFLRFLWNSIVMTGSITVLQIIFSAMAGYAFARIPFPGSNIVFFIVLGTMMIPFPITIIPNFLIIANLGWLDTYWALIVPRAVSAFAVFLFRQFFMELPKELEEAAFMDGARRHNIFLRILIPLAKPVIAANAVFSFLFAWNDFLWPLIVTNSTEMRTIQVGLAFFQGQYGTFWTLLMAAGMLTSLPAILVFLIAQNKFIEGITTSGLKG